MMQISASIVVHNEKEEILKRAIESFLHLDCKKELIVLDNSYEDSLRSVCEKYDNTHYLFLNENVGFGKGHNLAFANLNAKSDIHLVLNPDIFFDKEEIERFLDWFYYDKKTVLAIPQVRYPDGSLQNVVRRIPTPLSLIKRKLKKNHDEIMIADGDIVEIPFAHGCFMAFKTDVYKQLNGFDERFFMYMEDVDIWLRAKQYGKTMINTNYTIYHEHRKGSARNLKLLWFHIVSAYKFFVKHRYN